MFETGMEMTLERNRLSARALLRGWKDGAYMLMEMPDLRWKQNDPSPIVARTFRKGKYYGFTTKYVGALPEVNLVILEYPEDIIDNAMRAAERYAVTLPVKLATKYKGASFEYEGIITDISKGGCLLRSSRALKVNDTYIISGTFPAGENFGGILLTTLTAEGSEGRFENRCRFDSIPPEDERALSRFLGMVKTVHGG